MNTNPETPMNMEWTHHWQKSRFTLYSPTSGKTSRVEGWKVRIANGYHPPAPGQTPEDRVEFDAFVTPSSHVPWVGYHQDIYLANGAAVTGVRFIPGVGLQFFPSLVTKTHPQAESLETLKLYIQNQVDYGVASYHRIGIEGKTQKMIVSLLDCDLRDVFKRSLFHDESSGGSDEYQRLVSFKIADGVLKVDMERYKGRQKGTVWIRLADRTLIRAVENGVEIRLADCTLIRTTENGLQGAPEENK